MASGAALSYPLGCGDHQVISLDGHNTVDEASASRTTVPSNS